MSVVRYSDVLPSLQCAHESTVSLHVVWPFYNLLIPAWSAASKRKCWEGMPDSSSARLQLQETPSPACMRSSMRWPVETSLLETVFLDMPHDSSVPPRDAHGQNHSNSQLWST